MDRYSGTGSVSSAFFKVNPKGRSDGLGSLLFKIGLISLFLATPVVAANTVPTYGGDRIREMSASLSMTYKEASHD